MAGNMGYTDQHIHCSVSNCNYWDQGNICVASEVLVTSDAIGASQPDSYDHKAATSMSATPVDTCMATCCKTFVEKGSPNIQEDKVTRLR